MKEQHSNTLHPDSNSKAHLASEVATPDGQASADPSTAVETTDAKAGNLLADGLEQGKNLFNEHKGKLAIGVAATLGLMVFYKWREKKLAEEDPEEYARLQRLKAIVRANEAQTRNEKSSAKKDE